MLAFFLTRAGARVSVYEKHTIGSGATGASMGVLIPFGFSRTHTMATQQRTSLNMWAALGADYPQLTYTRRSRLQLLFTAGQHAQAQADAAASEGVQQLLSPEALQAQCPQAAPAPYGALLCNATAQVHPQQVLHALADLCRQNGAAIHEHTPVQRLDEVPADIRILTTGAATNSLWPDAGIRPYKGEALKLAAPGVELPYMLRSREGYITARDGHIWVGSTNAPDSGFDATPTAAGRAELLRIATTLCPALADAEVIDHWAGLRPMAPKNSPLFQQLDGRTWLAAGHGKIGLCLAPAVAAGLTQALTVNSIAI